MNQRFINEKYKVIFHPFSEKNYRKDFEKKHKNNWKATETSIKDVLARIAKLDGTKYIDCICKSCKKSFLVKFDFKIAKTDKSSKKSGNRCILEVCNEEKCIYILLVYNKSHLPKNKGETVWWKEIVLENFGLICVE